MDELANGWRAGLVYWTVLKCCDDGQMGMDGARLGPGIGGQRPREKDRRARGGAGRGAQGGSGRRIRVKLQARFFFFGKNGVFFIHFDRRHPTQLGTSRW